MKVLSFPSQKNQTTSFSPDVSEVITINFKTKEVTKMVETDNQTNQVISSFEMWDRPQAFMGEGFGEIMNLSLKKYAK